jgi:hypothetical protein
VLARRTVGRARFTLRAGRSRTIQVRLDRAGRRAAQRHRPALKVRVSMR